MSAVSTRDARAPFGDVPDSPHENCPTVRQFPTATRPHRWQFGALFARPMGADRSNSRQRPCLVRYLAPQRGTKAGAPASSLLLAEIKFPIICCSRKSNFLSLIVSPLSLSAVGLVLLHNNWCLCSLGGFLFWMALNVYPATILGHSLLLLLF